MRRALLTVGILTAIAAPALAATKRGVASSRYLSAAPAVLAKLHASWAYDWSWEAPPRSPGLEWVPMVWGSGSVSSRSVDALRADRRSGRARTLLGFNEPDSASQADMTPERAAALWPQLESTGLRLGSPAPAVPGDGWLDRFMSIARARRLRVDFVALHFYQDFSDPLAVGELRRELIAIHRRFEKPIWITEIGALDIRAWGEHMDAAPTGARASAYMRRLVAMLDRLGFVQRYAWFTDACASPGCPYSALVGAGGRLTARGRIYSEQS
ncbi:MAG TPA: glycosyl hydrolase [Solirubrobacteraceae bacterium]|jgi:hypothetical protein